MENCTKNGNCQKDQQKQPKAKKTALSMGASFCGTLSEPNQYIMGAAKQWCPWQYTEQEQNQTMLQRHQNTIQKLFKVQPKTCPREAYIFKYLKGLVSSDNDQFLGNQIAARQPVFIKSIQQANLHTIDNTSGIIRWFRPNDTATPSLSSWKRDHLRDDPFSKQQRQIHKSQGYQPTLKHFLTLHNVL